MRGPLRPPSIFPMDPTPFVFHHIPQIYHTRLLSCWTPFLKKYFVWAKMAWNAIVCETTDVSGGNSIFPIFQNTWFQAILAPPKKTKKKRKKRFIHRVRGFYGVRRSCRARWFDSMCTCAAVERDALAGVRRICGMRRIPSMHGWYRDHIGKFRGQNQNSNPKASPNFQGHTSGFYFSEFTLGEAPGKKQANFYSANL